MPLANWNGRELPLDQVRVSVLDRAFLFGDAVYEGIRAYGGRIWLCDEHMARLSNSLEQVRIKCDVPTIRTRMIETLRHSKASDAFIYIQISRGVGATRTHRFPNEILVPSELIYVVDLAGDPRAEVCVSGVPVITQPDMRWGRTDIKSTNLLANCLANQAAFEAGCHEAILVAADGSITEGSHTSFFAVKDGQLLTYPNSQDILPGVTRGFVLDLATRHGIKFIERPVRVDELPEIDEAFLTGTMSGIHPVVAMDQRAVGDGGVGPITKTLQDLYLAAVSSWLESDGTT